jgi:hypothetical protein
MISLSPDSSDALIFPLDPPILWSRMPKMTSDVDVDQAFHRVSAASGGHNFLGNIINPIAVKIRAYKIYLFTTFALVLIGVIVCIPTVILPKDRSDAER